jgi:hypothetical protein
MKPVKRNPGRPRGTVYPRRLPIYDTDEGIALLQELARRRGASAAAFVRQLVREEAARAGIASPAAADSERQAAARERFRQLVEKARSGPSSELTPEEIEREVALARAEVRETRRADHR